MLEDGGYYCVDNLPATLLEDVVGFLAEAGHERVAVSVDARSAALAALPESVARLKAGGADCRVLFLEANPPTLMRRFSETRRRHPLTVEGLTLAEAIERERALLGGAPNWATASTPATCCPRCCATGSATCWAWPVVRSPSCSSPSLFATAFRSTPTG